MGVPSYFAWWVKYYAEHILSHRLPCLDLGGGAGDSTVTLYLDFNGIIHPAIRTDISLKRSDMNAAVIAYLKTVVAAVKPAEIYIAIDGVAPFAKMDQQRDRRFKSSKEHKIKHDIAVKHGREVRGESIDFNMISPGTEFMMELQRYLVVFLEKQRATEWKNIHVTLNGSDVPGEGEHKIMQDIRQRTSVSGINGVNGVGSARTGKQKMVPCIYGLDADLMFLSLLNAPDAYLVRENMAFQGRDKLGLDPVKYPYIYLSISELRRIMIETLKPQTGISDLKSRGFVTTLNIQLPTPIPVKQPSSQTLKQSSQKSQTLQKSSQTLQKSSQTLQKSSQTLQKSSQTHANSDYHTNYHTEHYNDADDGLTDGQRLVVDYTYICFFLGNDFLPRLPCLKIRNGSLNDLILIYKKVSWLLGCYMITKDYSIDHNFLDAFLLEISQVEDALCRDLAERRNMDIGKHRFHLQNKSEHDREIDDFEYIEDKYSDIVRAGTDPGWRIRYYEYFLKWTYRHEKVFRRNLLPVCQEYIRGTVWVLYYYLGKHNNWDWIYPYIVAPTACDLYESVPSLDLKVMFRSNLPVSPYVQLLSILPPDSSDLLPLPLRSLMLDKDSPIVYMYPTKITLALLGNKFWHECRAWLPHVDQQALAGLVQIKERYFSKEERERNGVGRVLTM